MINVVLVIVAALFCLKIAWNLAVPYVLAVRALDASNGQTKGISLMPAVEILLLLVGIVVSLWGARQWPWTPGGLAAYGGAIVVASYLHLAVAGAIAGWIARRIR